MVSPLKFHRWISVSRRVEVTTFVEYPENRCVGVYRGFRVGPPFLSSTSVEVQGRVV